MPYIRSVPLRRNIRRSICSSTKTSCSTKTPARKSYVKKIVFYRRYSLDKTHLELLAQVRQIPVTPDTAIVGCPLLPQIVHPAPMPIYSIRPSESTMLSVLLYAQELLVFQKKDSQQLSMMSSILSHVTDGIILYAKGGAIYHINKRAASFLGIPVTTKNMRDIFPDWTEGSSPSFHETILQRPPYTLIANSDFFLMDSTSHYILTIRDVTELQRLEKISAINSPRRV